MTSPLTPEPGWYGDRDDPTSLRYWDGQNWQQLPPPPDVETAADKEALPSRRTPIGDRRPTGGKLTVIRGGRRRLLVGLAVAVIAVVGTGALALNRFGADAPPSVADSSATPIANGEREPQADDEGSAVEETEDATTLPVFRGDVDTADPEDVDAFGRFLEAHVQEEVRLHVRWLHPMDDTFGAHPESGLTVYPACGMTCEGAVIAGIEMGVDNLSSASDVSFHGYGNRWWMIGKFFVEHVEIGTGGVWILHLRAGGAAP